MPNSQQFLPEGGCCTRDPGEGCVALWEHPSSGWVIQTHSGFVGGGKVGIPDLPSFVHQCSRHPVKARGGWAASLWTAKHLSMLLRFVFSFLKLGPDYTGKHPCWAGQAGWVCPAAGRGGLWQPVQQLLPSCWPGVLLCNSVVCNYQLLSSFSSGLGWGWQLLGWQAGLGGAFILLVCDLCRSQLVQACRISPALLTLAQNLLLGPQADRCFWELAKKETEVLMLLNQKSRKYTTSLPPPWQSYSKLHQRVFFYGSSFTWFCNHARMTKAFNTRKVITTVKFPPSDLPW